MTDYEKFRYSLADIQECLEYCEDYGHSLRVSKEMIEVMTLVEGAATRLKAVTDIVSSSFGL